MQCTICLYTCGKDTCIKLSVFKEGGQEKPCRDRTHRGPYHYQAAKCTFHHDGRGELRDGLHGGRGVRVLSFSVPGG